MRISLRVVVVSRVRDLARSRRGMLLLVGLALSTAWFVAAATLGNRSNTELPSFPPYYGRVYDVWAFPLNPDVGGDTVDVIGRRVVLGEGEPNIITVLTNVVRNLIANVPAYAMPSVPGVLVNVGYKLTRILSPRRFVERDHIRLETEHDQLRKRGRLWFLAVS